MKIKLLIFSLLFSIMSWGQTTIAAWTFPTASGNAPATLSAECGVFSGSSNFYANGTNGSSNWPAATTRQYFGGVAPASSLCGVTTATGAYSLVSPATPFNNGFSVVYKMPTTGYRDLILTYASRGTATGYTTHDWSYSTDGVTFTPHATISGRNATTFSNLTVDFSAISALDDLPNIYIKLTVSGATTAAGGNNRLDNLNFAATIIPVATYTVTYNGNTNDTGTAPVDASSPYASGATVTVLGNTGSLAKTGYTFNGWNTAANGSGTAYVAGNTFAISTNTTLYAQWLLSLCTSPSTQASAISTTNSTLNGFDVNWTQGNGDGTMIVVRENALANTLPTAGTAYSANLAWASAGQIDANNRVIFRDMGSSATPVTGLNPGTEYRVTAYEYSTIGDCYNLSAPSTTVAYTVSTEPTAHAATFTCTSVSPTQINLNFSAANTITNGRGYVILSKIGSAPTGLPTDGVFHTPGSTIGDATVVGYTSLAGTDTTFSATGLLSNTNYHFVLIPLNSYLSVAQTINYRVAATIPSSNCTTLMAPCVSEDFVSFADWINNGTASDAVASHYGAASPCRALGVGDDLISPSVNYPTLLQFHQDNSNPGTGTVDYRIGAGPWIACHSFVTSNAGANETVDLTNVGGVNLSLESNVTFRFNSTFNTWYLDDVVVTCGLAPSPCTTPVAQPTALNFSAVTGTGFNASFTAAVPASTGYLVVYSTNATLSAGDLPVAGTTYTAGNALGDGTIAYAGTGNAFSVSGLIDGTTYYVFVFSYNSGVCTIAYNTTLPLSGNIITATIWNGTAWSDGIPTLGKFAIINGNYNTTANGDIDARSLIVNVGFTVTVTDNHYVNIQNDLTVNGALEVQNNGSLVQINDAGVNTGNIIMRRTANIRLLDYVYWSSPVANFGLSGISPATPLNKLWKWDTTVTNPNGGFGNWQNANETMSIAKGYIVRAPNGFTTTQQAFTANFTGVPNNGIYTAAIQRGSNTAADYIGSNGTIITNKEDNWNLIGNPYPSAISSMDFLTANTNIEGSIRIWTHNTLPNTGISNPFYNSYTYNYTSNDYIVYNGTATTSGPAGFNGLIGAGQSFFVLMNDGAATSETVTFNNALRNKGYNNSQFYKNATSGKNTELNIERHRIWLDLISSTGTVNRTVVGYVEGATQQKDRMFDASTDYKNAQNFYSLINDEIMLIQGRSLPFDMNDTVPMGITVPVNGTYNIAIAAVDGLFQNGAQIVYLEDKLLNVIHNLTVSPYQFTANQGKTNNRFVLRYTDNTLGNTNFDVAENTVKIYASGNGIHMNSILENIKDYVVYNVLGQTVASKNNVNTNQSVVNSIMKNNQALIVKVTLENGQIETRKIIF